MHITLSQVIELVPLHGFLFDDVHLSQQMYIANADI